MGTTSKYMKRTAGKRVMKFEDGGKVPGTTDTMSDGAVLWRSGKTSADDLRSYTKKRIDEGERDDNKLGLLARTTGDMAHAEFMDRMDAKYPSTKTHGRKKD